VIFSSLQNNLKKDKEMVLKMSANGWPERACQRRVWFG